MSTAGVISGLVALVLCACDGSSDAGTGAGGAAGSGATGSGATGSGATGSGATGSGATGSGATGSGATGATAGIAGAGNADGGGTAGAAATGGAAGTGGSACSTLEDQYAGAISNAKVCSTASTTSCTEAIDTSIDGCGYYVFGDGMNTQALDDLAEIKAEWSTLGCDPTTSCAVGGFPPMTAKCEPTGQGGAMGVCVPGNG